MLEALLITAREDHLRVHRTSGSQQFFESQRDLLQRDLAEQEQRLRQFKDDQGLAALLQLLPMSANVGAGLLYVICWITNTGFAEHAQIVTYEYGNTFLLVAGLLNYLAMLDAFDIAAGRKQ